MRIKERPRCYGLAGQCWLLITSKALQQYSSKLQNYFGVNLFNWSFSGFATSHLKIQTLKRSQPVKIVIKGERSVSRSMQGAATVL